MLVEGNTGDISINATGYLTATGTQLLANWIYVNLRNGRYEVGIYKDNTKIKDLPATYELVGTQVIVSASDESADEYDFNKAIIETSNGVRFAVTYSELKHKSATNKVNIQVALPVLPSGGASG